MKKVAAYIRVSTDGQVGEDKFGLESQREMIKSYCEKNDMSIIKWFTDEGESGAYERPGFDAIVYGDVVNPPFEAVVVAKSDRVARDIKVYYYYKMLLTKKDVQLISISEDFGTFGVFADMLEAFTLCCAQMERENITKRTSGGRAIKAASGGYSGGVCPTGYRAVDRKMVIVPEEAETVRELFRLRDEEHLTLKQTADRLNAQGRVTGNGAKFYPSTVQKIERNRRVYQGQYRYGGEGAKWVDGQHEAILPRVSVLDIASE